MRHYKFPPLLHAVWTCGSDWAAARCWYVLIMQHMQPILSLCHPFALQLTMQLSDYAKSQSVMVRSSYIIKVAKCGGLTPWLYLMT